MVPGWSSWSNGSNWWGAPLTRLAAPVAVVSLVAVSVAGCSGGSDERSSRPPGTPPAGDEGEDEDEDGNEDDDKQRRTGCVVDDGRSIEPEVDVGSLDVVNHHLQMLAVGDDVLLAKARVDNGVERRGPDIVRSTDCGATWERLDLPDAPAMPDSGMGDTLALVGDVVVVTADIHLDPTPEGDNAYVWTSGDGQGWKGGPVTVPSPDAAQALGSSPASPLPDGRLIVSLDFAIDTAQQVLLSDDRGATWQVADCPAESLQQVGTGFACWNLMGAGGLWAQRFAGEVSLDEGQTWQRPALEPERPDLTDFPKIESLVALSGGGWLATFLADVDDCPSFTLSGPSSCVGDVARSDDGVHWEATMDLTDSCHADASLDEPNSLFTAPVPFGDGWLVVYTCADGIEPRWSEAYALDADGRNPRLVRDIDRGGASFGQPVAVGDGIVLPRIDPDGTSATLLQLQP